MSELDVYPADVTVELLVDEDAAPAAVAEALREWLEGRKDVLQSRVLYLGDERSDAHA